MRPALLLALALCAAPASAASANPYLSQAKVFYRHYRFEKCLERLEVARERYANAAQDEVELELYAGLCRLGLGHQLDARVHFGRALKLDRQARLPAGVSPRVNELFERLREKPLEELEPKVEAPPNEPNPPAAPGLFDKVDLSRHHLLPPLSLGGGALLATVVASVFGAEARSLEGQANRAIFESDIYRLGNSARTNATAANVCFAVAGAALVAAVVSWFLFE